MPPFFPLLAVAVAFVFLVLGARPALAQAPPPLPVSAPAQAAPPPASAFLNPLPTRLRYIVGKGAQCPPEQHFRNRMAGLTDGRDPFTGAPGPMVVVEARRDGRRYGAKVTLLDDQGNVLAGPKDEVFAADCAEALSLAGLEASFWFSPPMPAPTPPPAPAPPAAPPAPPPPPPAPKIPEPPSRAEIPPDDLPPASPPKPPPTPNLWRFRLGASAWGEYAATLLKFDLGVTANVGFRYDTFSAALQVRWDLPLSNGTQSVGAISEGLALCGHVQTYFVPCGLAEVSEVQVLGTRGTVPGFSLTRGAIGGRLSADVPIWRPHVFVVPALDVLGVFYTFNRYNSTNSSNDPIKLSPVNVRLGAGLLLEFGSP